MFVYICPCACFIIIINDELAQANVYLLSSALNVVRSWTSKSAS